MYIIEYKGIAEDGTEFSGTLETKSSRYSKVKDLVDREVPYNLRTCKEFSMNKRKK